MEQRNACRAIEMKLPAEKDMLLVVRLTASGILTRCGAMLDVMDDFKIAVEEACSLLIAQTEYGGELHLRFEMAPGRASFEAHCQGKCVSGADLRQQETALCILEALVTEARLECGGEGVRGVYLAASLGR